MKKLIVIAAMAALSGCSTVKSWVPSFSDPNQSHSIIDVRLAVDQLDCSQPQLPQAQLIYDRIRWFELYSESAGWRHADVLRLTAPIKLSVQDFVRRSRDQQGSVAYCEIKKKLLTQQTATAAEAILGRF